jgi:hypothetical protein
MKYRKMIYLLVAATVLISSCKKFLETTPLSNNTPETFYGTEKQIMSALAGVYDRISRSQTYGDQMLGRMGLDADEAFFNNSAIEGVAVYNVSSSDVNIANNYNFWYDGINRANALLENLNKATMNEENRKVVRGEALFLRAYYHFMLVLYWGDVPLMTKTVKSANETYAIRTPAKQVYEQIITDMTEAETLVKTAQEVGFGGRINKSAVRGILARVCLQMAGEPVNDVSKYKAARDWALKVMMPDPKDGFQHTLNPSYQDVFIKYCQDKYDIGESIWEAEFQGNGTDGFQETGRVGSNNGIVYSGTDPNYGFSYGYLNATARLWYLFDNPTQLLSSDERRDWSIAPYTTTGTPVIETAFTATQIYERTSGKWRRELEIVNPKTNNWGPINFPLLRFSDVLLMFAEADNKVNGAPTAAAIDAVNKVRRRAYGKDLPAEAVRMVQVTNGGTTNYTSAPTVVFTGVGSGATAKAFISAGKVVRVKMLTEGTGYTTAPTISFTGGGGAGAIATALTSKRATSDYELTASQTGSPEAFQQAIEDERSRELSFECLRKADLIRWGKFLTNMKRIEKDMTIGNSPIPTAPANLQVRALAFRSATDRDLLWPFSPSEMSLNTGLRPQNPGF